MFSFKSALVTSALSLALSWLALGQQNCGDSIQSVESDGTISIDLSNFQADGISPSPAPAARHLDSCTWQVQSRNSTQDLVTVEFGQSAEGAGGFFHEGEMTQRRLLNNNAPGGVYYYRASNNQTVIWIKPRANVFSPGSMTARFNITAMPAADLELNQQLYFYRRNNTEYNPVKLDFSYNVGSTFNQTALKPAFLPPFNTSIITQTQTLGTQCYRITIPRSLLRAGEKLYISWRVDDAEQGRSGIRDDIGFDPAAPLGMRQDCISYTVYDADSENDPDTTSATDTAPISDNATTPVFSVTPPSITESNGAIRHSANVMLGLSMLVYAILHKPL